MGDSLISGHRLQVWRRRLGKTAARWTQATGIGDIHLSNQTTDLVSVVEEFKKDISTGGANNGNLLGSLPNGYGTVEWDTVGLGHGINQNNLVYVVKSVF